MKQVLISTILYFFIGSGLCQREKYHEIDLINRMNQFYGFDHNIFLLDTLTDHNRLNLAMNNRDGNVTAQTVYIFNHNLIGAELATVESLGSKKTFLIIMATHLQFGGNTQLLSQIKVIQRRLGTNVNVGIFFVNKAISVDLVERLFRWSWSTGIVKIFCAFYSNTSVFNIFGYDPFVTFDLINLTESESLYNYFPSGVPNYRGHPLRCGLADFVYVADTDDNFWGVVVRVFNATRSEVVYSQGNDNVNADVLIHAKNFLDKQRSCYPHRTVTLVLMVPHAQPYSDFLSYLQNATWTLIFVYTFVAVAAATLVLIISGYLQTKKISPFKYATNIINLLMNDNGAIRYGQLKCADICIVVPFTFAGLIAVNGILSVFQSYLSVPIYERQINTIDDLFKSPVKILVEYTWRSDIIVTLEDLSHHGGWGKKVQSTDSDQLFRKVQSYNSSVAFVGFTNEVQLHMKTQKRLGVKAYHLITQPYLVKAPVGFMVFGNFPFIEPINDLVHRLLSAGLIQKWMIDQEHITLNNLFRQRVHLQVKPSVESRSISEEFGVPNFVWCGWMASVILFICEITWNRLKSQIERMKARRKKLKILCVAI